MGDQIPHDLLGFYLICTLIFVTNIGIIGSSELQPGEAFVCGPRTIYGRFKVIERTYEPCETGSCLVERARYENHKHVYYCCPGYSQTGLSCSQECDAEHYGENCTEICTCAAEHATGCNAASGECDCVPGKGGANCTDNCTQGTFGVTCRGTCNCSHTDVNATCEPINGTCNCSSEFYGDNCEFRYSTTTSGNTVIGSTKDTTHRSLVIQQDVLGVSVTIAIFCIAILVLVIIVLLLIVWCARKQTGATQQQNSTTIDGGQYYSSIPENVTQGAAGSTTGTTSLNLNDSENSSDLRGAHAFTDPVAYATSIGVFGATTETTANSITHTYMEGQQNMSASVGVPRKVVNASTQTSSDDIIAYAESEAVPHAQAEMIGMDSITHSYMDRPLNMPGLGMSNAADPVAYAMSDTVHNQIT